MRLGLMILSLGVFPLMALAEGDLAVGLLPGDKRSATVPPTARNPFTKKEVPKLEIEVPPEEDTASEENQIRSVLNGLRVVGRTRAANGWKVLLGDMILEDGTTLPPVLEGQTQTLRVRRIHEKLLEIEWVEVATNDPPRLIVLQVDLAPRVSTALSGSSSAAEGGQAPAVVSTQPRGR